MRDGRILQNGAAREVYDRPADAFVATFLGRTNLLEGTAEGGFVRTSLGLLPLTRPASGRVSISLRPERLGIRAVEADEQPNGRIVAVEFKGHDMTYWVDCAGVEVQVDAVHSVRLAEGTPVRVAVDGEAVPLDVGSL